MHLIGSALGDGVHKAAAGLAKFGFESGTGDLEFADYVFAELKGDGASDLLRKEGVVVVAAVDCVVVITTVRLKLEQNQLVNVSS